MIVGFLDLLGFSQLLDLSTEVAHDNVNSFNNAIKTKVIDNMTHPIEEYKKNYPDDQHFQKFVEKSAVSSFEYLISFSDSLIIGSNSVELFIEQLCNLVSSLYIDSSEPFSRQFDDVFNVKSRKVLVSAVLSVRAGVGNCDFCLPGRAGIRGSACATDGAETG